MQLEQIDIKHFDKHLSDINSIFEKLKKKVSMEEQKNLEYAIYYFCNDVAEIQRIYARNLYKINKIIDDEFGDEREKQNSDLATTKSLNKKHREEKTLLELQEMVVEWLNKKEDIFKRLANFINNERINALAVAKQI